MSPPSDVLIYVDATTGKDWNDGTQAMPVQTLSRALSLVPLGYFAKCRIILAPGTYNEASPISFRLPRPVGPNAIDFAIVGQTMTNVLGDLTCTANDTTGLLYTANTPPFPADAFFGATLYCVSGANKEASRTIVKSTATTPTKFTINKPWNSAPAAGDVFQVQRPAVIINHVGIAFWGPGPFVCLQHLKFSYTGTDPQKGFSAAFLVKFAAESVEMDLHGGVFALFHYCGINPGSELASLFPASSFSPSREADWYIHNGTMSLTNRCQVPNSNNLVTQDLSIKCADSCTLAPNSIFGHRTDISLISYCSLNHEGIAAHRSWLDTSNNVGAVLNPFIVKADKNSIVGGGNAGFQHIELKNSGGDAILLQGNSHGYLGDVSGFGSTPGVGVKCTHMSTARVHQSGLGAGVATSVKGSLDDTSIGGILKAYSALPFTAGDTLCRIEF